MELNSYTTTIVVNQSANEVYNAINNVRAWWHGEVVGTANALNDEFGYRMKDIHYSLQKVIELVPNKKIVWLVTDSQLNFTNNKTEWTGTEIVFEIMEEENRTKVGFTHVGLVPKFECYGGCSNGWKMLIEQSLYSLITTGKGIDVFN
jgi:hypothetical protein